MYQDNFTLWLRITQFIHTPLLLLVHTAAVFFKNSVCNKCNKKVNDISRFSFDNPHIFELVLLKVSIDSKVYKTS